MTQYGDEIVGERAKRRLNQTEVAERAGIFRSTLIDIENNRIGIDEPTYERIITVIRQDDKSNCAA